MVETAVAVFGLSLSQAWRLTLTEYRQHARVARRRWKIEHARDLWLSWMTAFFARNPTPFDDVQRMAEGRGKGERVNPDDPDGALNLQRWLAAKQGFETWYEQDRAANANKEVA